VKGSFDLRGLAARPRKGQSSACGTRGRLKVLARLVELRTLRRDAAMANSEPAFVGFDADGGLAREMKQRMRINPIRGLDFEVLTRQIDVQRRACRRNSR
jgi:hypothetical protein